MNKFKHLIILTFLFIASLFVLSACDKTCQHQWIEANCLYPKTCEFCNETQGEALGHKFSKATCTEPKTCKICNETEGEVLGHQGSESSEWDIDYDTATKVQEYCCTICDEMITIQSVPVTTFASDNNFTISASSFAGRFENASRQLNNINYRTKMEYNTDMSFYDEDNTLFYRIQDKNNDDEDIGIMDFTQSNGKTIAVRDLGTQNYVGKITMLIENSYDVSAVVYSAILAIDPKIGYSEAAEVGQIIVDNIAINIGEIDEKDFQGTDYNGINYLLYRDNKYHYLIISTASSI